MDQLDIKFGFIFPWTFRFVGALLVFSSIVLAFKIFWWSAILFPMGAVFLSAYEGTEIDTVKRVYREYNSYLLIKFGKFKAYDSIERLYVNSKMVTERMYSAHTNKSSNFRDQVFSAYIKFSSGEKALLLSEKNKGRIMNKLGRISQSLNVALTDHTIEN